LGDSSELRRVSVTEQSSKVEHLATALGELKTVTMHKGQMSRRFSIDFQHFAKMVQQMRMETRKMAKSLPAASDATDVNNEIELDYLQQCLGFLEDDLKVVRSMVTAVPSRKVTAGVTAEGGDVLSGGVLGNIEAKSSAPSEVEIDSDDDVITEALQNFEDRYSFDAMKASSERQSLVESEEA